MIGNSSKRVKLSNNQDRTNDETLEKQYMSSEWYEALADEFEKPYFKKVQLI